MFSGRTHRIYVIAPCFLLAKRIHTNNIVLHYTDICFAIYVPMTASRAPQALLILHDQEAYFPAFVHAAVDQDRPVGDTRTFHEHTHNLYHIVLL